MVEAAMVGSRMIAWYCCFHVQLHESACFSHWGRDGTSYEHGVAQGQGRCSLADTKINFRISVEIDDFRRFFFVLLVLVYTCCESSRFPPESNECEGCCCCCCSSSSCCCEWSCSLYHVLFGRHHLPATPILLFFSCFFLRNSIAVENFQRFWSKTFQMLQSYLVDFSCKLGHRTSKVGLIEGFLTIQPPTKTIRIFGQIDTYWLHWDQRKGFIGDGCFQK